MASKHLYAGLCPDDIEGDDTRDPECPACRELDANTSLRARVAVLEAALRGQIQHCIRCGGAGREGRSPFNRSNDKRPACSLCAPARAALEGAAPESEGRNVE